MALDEIRLWAADGSGGATPLEAAERMQSELLLEDTLVNNPDMLMPGLTLVGRQTPTEGGPLDLLGVDDDGRLVVFELKRGRLSREAVAQVIDYASFLESKPDNELANYISERSGTHGIAKIEDFEEWYGENRGGQELSELRRIRLFLVGLGVDDTTNRMARFLADRGVNISLLTFHGYSYNGTTLLARQVQVEAVPEPEEAERPPRRPGRRERRELLDNRIRERAKQWPEAKQLWDSALTMFQENVDGLTERPIGGLGGQREWGRYRLNLRLSRRRYAAIQLDTQQVLVIFFGNAVELCLEEFTQLRQEMPFQAHPANRSEEEKKAGVVEIQFVIRSLSEWETHKDKLAAVARSVSEAVYAGEDEE